MCTENQNQNENVYTMPLVRLDEAIAKIDAANRRAERAGIAVRFTYSVEFFQKKHEDRQTGVVFYTQMVDLVLNRPVIRHEGWTFLASLQWDEEAGLIVHSVPGVALGDRSQFDACRCDVCHTSRQRNDTFVVENDQTGERLQVGRNCLAQFMGIAPSGLWMLTWDDLASSLPDEEAESLGRSARIARLPVEAVLQATVAICLESGWVSRARAEAEQKRATSSLVMSMFAPFDAEERRWANERWEVARGEHATSLAKQIRETALAAEGDGDYITNLRALLSAQTVESRNIALVASAYAVWQREQEQAIALRTTAASRWIGTVGAKVEIAGKVSSLRHLENDWGVTTLLVVESEGNVVKWFASGEKEFEIGSRIRLAGTVKAHDEYKGRKETVMTRCKVR
jgi:hypothetical protein